MVWGCLGGGAAATVAIVPTYVDGAGETWTPERMAVISQAISDWTSALAAPTSDGNVTVNVTVDFTSAGAGYLGQWQGGTEPLFPGESTRPWLKTEHEIHFNADRFSGANYLWWDSSPGDDGSDQPFAAWDALSVARHEIGHMLGFSSSLYLDNFNQVDEVSLWQEHVTISGSTATFDPGGLNVSLASATNQGHVLDSGGTAADLMVPALVNGDRRGISSTDLQMLSLAYDYVLIPEPGVAGLFAVTIVLGVGRRRRLA